MNKNFNKKLHKMLTVYLMKINSVSLLCGANLSNFFCEKV